MARHVFGGTVADYGITVGAGNVATLSAGTVTFWNQRAGGVQYTDLLDLEGNPADHTVASAGDDGWALGNFRQVYGPDGIWIMWAQLNAGPRCLVVSPALGDTLAPLVDVLNAAFEAHVSAPNPHAMRMQHLSDVASAEPLDGQVPVFTAAFGAYVPTTVEGLNPADFVRVGGGSEIIVPGGDTTTKALVVRIPAGNRGGAANTVEVWWNAGTDGEPNWQLVTRLNEYGEFRGQASRGDRVFGRIKQYNNSHTADLWQFTDWNNTPLSWVDAQGRVRAPNIAITPTWTQDTAATGVGTYRFYNPAGTDLTIRGFALSCGSPPAGGELIINPKLDAAAIYSATNRPRLSAGSHYSGLATALSTSTWPAGSYLTVDVDQVPSTPGTKLVIQGLAY